MSPKNDYKNCYMKIKYVQYFIFSIYQSEVLSCVYYKDYVSYIM